MTCPMHKGKTKEDALCLANKMKKITVADTLENMEVCISPFSVHNGDICSIYKLKIRLVKPGRTCETEHDGGDDTGDEERGEDLGLDVQKQKQQTTYEMDYEDDSGGEQLESEIDMSKDEKIAENALRRNVFSCLDESGLRCTENKGAD
ncbi:hypothetical protein F383_25146 [Gossypium arboreum]|uniref:Uncharacterized protein n=1 Tax=Gossypium arboreum TaxID=29729 RepID=A0A0B0P5W0_GOSAR|nr:hypothetical protein F383_25146 [Gossypium arboreum]